MELHKTHEGYLPWVLPWRWMAANISPVKCTLFTLSCEWKDSEEGRTCQTLMGMGVGGYLFTVIIIIIIMTRSELIQSVSITKLIMSTLNLLQALFTFSLLVLLFHVKCVCVFKKCISLIYDEKNPFSHQFQTLAAISFVSIILTPFSLFSSPPLLTCFVTMDTPTLKPIGWPVEVSGRWGVTVAGPREISAR